MQWNFKTALSMAVAALGLGFCVVAGGYLAHDLFRTVDDQNVVWLINRAAAAAVITLFVALGFIIARAIEYGFLRWWKKRQHPSIQDDD